MADQRMENRDREKSSGGAAKRGGENKRQSPSRSQPDYQSAVNHDRSNTGTMDDEIGRDESGTQGGQRGGDSQRREKNASRIARLGNHAPLTYY